MGGACIGETVMCELLCVCGNEHSHRYTQVHKSTCKYTQIHTGIQKYMHVYADTCMCTVIHRCTQVHAGTHRYMQVHKGVCKYMQIHACTQLHAGAHRCTKVYAGIRKYMQVCTGTHRYTQRAPVRSEGQMKHRVDLSLKCLRRNARKATSRNSGRHPPAFRPQ